MKNMHKLFAVLLLILVAVIGNAQGINFQGVARSANGTIIAGSNISLKLSILSKSVDATPEYVETKTVMTNTQGIFSVVVGDAAANASVGNFKNIAWVDGVKFLKVEMDPAGGTNFINMGATQLQYVPYSFYSLGVAAANVNGVLPVEKGGTGSTNLADLKYALDQSSGKADSLQNLKLGYEAFAKNKTGSQNVAIGYSALGNNTEGRINTAIGFSALYNNTTGSENTALGNSALVANTTGMANVAIGPWALFSNTTANSNAAMGHFALFKNVGTSNVAIGIDALRSNITGNNNTAIGTAVGDSLVDGDGNVIIGSNVGNHTNFKSINNKLLIANSATPNPLLYGSFDSTYLTINGDLKVTGKINGSKALFDKGHNVFIGETALKNIQNDYGIDNIAIGQNALLKMDQGSNNIAIGNNSLSKMVKGVNGSGLGNIAIGVYAMNSDSLSSGTIAIGQYALYNNMQSGNMALGNNALQANTTGGGNLAVGPGTLQYTVTASGNTAVGMNALNKTTTTGNTGIGSEALKNNTTGAYNTAVGGWVMNTNTTGTSNVAVGHRNLINNTTGSQNTSIGEASLTNNVTGSNNIAIGAGANVGTANLNNAIAIGNQAVVSTSNTIQLGNTDIKYVKTSGAITSNRGFLPPKMSASERDAIVDPEQGLTIYCYNCGSNGELEMYNGLAWVNVIGGTAAAEITDVTNGLVVSFALDGSPNGTITSTVIQGTTNGTVTYTTNRKGIANSAMQGGSGYITAPSSIFQFTRNQAFTVSVWFTADATASSGRLLSTENAEGNFRISKYDLNNMAIQYGDYITQTVTNSVWHHLVYTYNNRLEKIYIDGVLKQTNTDTDNEALNYGTPFTIGAKAASAYDKWAGKIDDVKVYNRDLLPTEVLILFNQ